MNGTEESKISDSEKIRIADHVIGIREIHGVFQKGSHRWKFRFPTPDDRRKIEVEIARRLEGMPVTSINPDEYTVIRMCAILDFVLVESPDWWKGAGDCRDEELIAEMFLKFAKDQENFRRRLREGQFTRNRQSEGA